MHMHRHIHPTCTHICTLTHIWRWGESKGTDILIYEKSTLIYPLVMGPSSDYKNFWRTRFRGTTGEIILVAAVEHTDHC